MEMRTIVPALVVATILLGNGIGCVQGTEEFVLIHGGGHGAWCWYRVANILQKAGYKITTLDMVSAGTRVKVDADNVSSIAQYTKPLTDYLASNVSGQVVLVGHSIGGVCITYAMEQYPSKISHAIFLTASMPANNQSLLSSGPPTLLTRLGALGVFTPNYGNGLTAPPTSVSLNLTVAPQVFYNLSPSLDITLALTLLDNIPFVTITEALTLTPARYGSVRRFYIQTDHDNVWGPGGEDTIRANNPPERTFFLNDTDHSTFFSRPVATAAIIVQISNL